VLDRIRYPVVELRQYTLRPGQRDVLISLFDRELVESQEAEGMTVVGQFRDLEQPDRFVWIRGFDDMQARAQALRAFYSGPAWKAHSAAANATMLDTDDVLLLRPATAHSGFPAPDQTRPPVGHIAASGARSRIVVTLYFGDRPFSPSFAGFFDHHVRPVLTETGAMLLACLQTEYSENTFPALPVRTGEHVFAWLARFDGQDDLSRHLRLLGESGHWQDSVLPALSAMLTRAPQQLQLAPTDRSTLR
jgi:quinol monooxygenase YgiN